MAKRRTSATEEQTLKEGEQSPEAVVSTVAPVPPETEVKADPKAPIELEPKGVSEPEAKADPKAPVELELKGLDRLHTPQEPKVKPDPKAPVELELRVGSTENKLPEKVSKEKIEASVKEKLSRKTDSPNSNPFIPQTQLENEIKEVAKNKGFPLSRGTEIGARLLARSKRPGG